MTSAYDRWLTDAPPDLRSDDQIEADAAERAKNKTAQLKAARNGDHKTAPVIRLDGAGADQRIKQVIRAILADKGTVMKSAYLGILHGYVSDEGVERQPNGI